MDVSTPETSSVEAIDGVVAASIAAAFLFPLVMLETAGVPSSGWSDGARALWGIFDQVMLLALFVAFFVVIMAAAGRSS